MEAVVNREEVKAKAKDLGISEAEVERQNELRVEAAEEFRKARRAQIAALREHDAEVRGNPDATS